MHHLISKINAHFLPLTEFRNLVQSAKNLYRSMLFNATIRHQITSTALTQEEVNAGFKSHFEPEAAVLHGYVMLYFLAALGRKSIRLIRLGLPVLSLMNKHHL